MMKKEILFLIILLFFPQVYSLRINEIMYNPIDGNEWIELYYLGNKSFDLEGLIFEDNYGIDEIVCCEFLDECITQIENSSFILLTDQDTTLYDENNISKEIIKLCVDDNSIGNGLGNSGDEINITQQGIQIDFLKYNYTVQKGKTISLINNSWIETISTPGEKNVIIFKEEKEDEIDVENYDEDTSIEIIIDDILYANNQYNNLFKLTNLNHISGKISNINLTIIYNITKNDSIIKYDNFSKTINSHSSSNTGNLLLENEGNYTLCGKIIISSINDTKLENNKICKEFIIIDTSNIDCNASLNLFSEKYLYDDGEKIGIYLNLSNTSFPYKIEYWIEDLFGISIKNKIQTNNLNKKSFTSSISNSVDVFVIKTNLTYIACNDSDIEDNHFEKMIIVKGKKELDSKFNIEKIYTGTDESLKFGEILRVKLNLYKGNSTKTSIKAWIENSDEDKISRVTYINLFDKYSNNEMTVPIQILPNCNEKFKSGKYKLIISGLDEIIYQKVQIEGITSSLCIKSTTTKTKEVTVEKEKIKQYELLNYDEKINLGDKLKSKIKITNIDEGDKIYTIWSYIYRGSKSYSGERENNKVEIRLEKDENNEIELENEIDEVESGEYKLKIKILKNGLKTPYEFTESIMVEYLDKNENQYCPIEIEKSKINSFYTRSKKFSENINLYVTLEDYSKNNTILLNTYEETKKISINSKNIKLNTSIKLGKNIIQLKLLEDDKEIDTSELIIYANETDINTYNNLISFYSDYDLSLIKKLKNVTLKDNLITGMATDEIIYNSSGQKMKSLLPFFILLTIFLTIIGFISMKKNK